MNKSNSILIVSLILSVLIISSCSSNIKPPALDKSCEVDSDCAYERATLCGMLCGPGPDDVYSKETAIKIGQWREDTSNKKARELCPIAECLPPDHNEISKPKCIDKQCKIETKSVAEIRSLNQSP